MASTFKPNQAFDFCKSMIHNMSLENIQVRILDEASKILWLSAPWRWTVGTLPAVSLTDNDTSYSVALPSDYLYTFDAFRTDDDNDTNELIVEPILPEVSFKGPVQRIAVTGTAGETGTMVVLPNPGVIPTSGIQIVSLYKKVAPTIKQSTINTAGQLAIPDDWFWVYTSCVLWLAYLYGDDERAGTSTVASNGNMQYTGQRGVFESNLRAMIEHEKMPSVYYRQPPQLRGER